MVLVSHALMTKIEALTEQLTARIFEQEPAYQAGRTISVEDLTNTVRANMTAVFSAIGGSPLDTTHFDANGRRRASSSIPLHAVLHAYRIGGLFYWESFARVAATVPFGDRVIAEGSGTVWQIIESASQLVTHGYRDEVEKRQRRNASERTALLELLLVGEFAAPSDLWDAADALSLPVSGTFVVVAAPTLTPGGEAIRDAQRVLLAVNCRSAWRSDTSTHVGLVSLGSLPQLLRVVSAINSVASGTVGLSDPFNDLTAAPEALRQARVAMAAGNGGPPGCVVFSHVPLQALLVTARQPAEHLRQTVLGSLLGTPDHEVLLKTLNAWVESGGSANACAALLYVHRNSVTRRLRQIKTLTGHDPRTPRGMAMLYVAMEAHVLLANHAPPGEIPRNAPLAPEVADSHVRGEQTDQHRITG